MGLAVEYHADMSPHCNSVDRCRIEVATTKANLPFESKASSKIVHAIEASEYGAFAATRWSDKRRDFTFINR